MIDFKYIEKLIDAEKFCKLLDYLDLLVNSVGKLPPNLLVLKGRCIQLSECNEYSLEDAKESFYEALKIDEKSIEALIELGWYYNTIENNPKKALSIFNKAMLYSKQVFLDAIEGCAYSINETESVNNAIKFIDLNSKLDTTLIKIKIEND